MWKETKIFFSLLLVIFIFALLLLLVPNTYTYYSLQTVYAYTLEEQQQNKIIDKIAYCESRNREYAYNSNDPYTPSIGLLQYKTKTWKWFSEKYHFKGDIWSGEDQRELTRRVMRGERYWKNHWKYCTRNI